MTDDSTGDDGGRLSEPVVLTLIGLAVAGLLLVASALPVVLSRDDGDGDEIAFTVVTSDAIADADPAAGSNGSLSTSPAPAATTVTTEPQPVTTTAPAPSAATSLPDEVPAGDVPESVAIVRGGKIVLEGAVPDEASRAEIVALAAEIFTPENVVDNYVIDPRAGNPNLGNIRVDDAVLFAADSAEILPDFEPLLNQGLALLTLRPAATFTIEGHTDSLGGEQYNLELSQARADAVVAWYVERGIDPARLTAIGKGETELIASDDTAEGRRRNRRIEVAIENLLVGDG